MLSGLSALSDRGPPMSTLTFENNPEPHRYEAFANGALAGYSGYNLLSERLVFTHTGVI